MGWKVSWQVKCEACDFLGPRHANSLKAEAKAKKAGWVIGQAYGMAMHLCPVCANKPRPEWWPDATGTRFNWEDET